MVHILERTVIQKSLFDELIENSEGVPRVGFFGWHLNSPKRSKYLSGYPARVPEFTRYVRPHRD